LGAAIACFACIFCFLMYPATQIRSKTRLRGFCVTKIISEKRFVWEKGSRKIFTYKSFSVLHIFFVLSRFRPSRFLWAYPGARQDTYPDNSRTGPRTATAPAPFYALPRELPVPGRLQGSSRVTPLADKIAPAPATTRSTATATCAAGGGRRGVSNTRGPVVAAGPLRPSSFFGALAPG
jgi:hypothetical protein